MTKKHLFQNGLALLMCLFLFAGASFAQKTKTITLSAAGESTWQVPDEIDGEAVTGVTSVVFEAWGGGGAGGYAYSTGILKSSGGGGGAAYAKSSTLTNVNVGDKFNITVGAPGTAKGDNPSSYTVQDGGNSYVYSSSNNLLVKAVGGKSVTGTQNLNGAAGGNKNDCEGAFTASGGNGGNAYGGLGSQTLGIRSGAWCISGSGGGAGGPGGNGGNADNSWFNGNLIGYLWDLINGEDAHALQITGQPGQGNGSGAGSGGMGIESQIFGGGGWGNAQGNDGGNFGGGGSGAIGNGVSWGDANGGQGGSGAVRITITYTTTPAESISISTDATSTTTNVCNNANFDLALNITATGFEAANATVQLGTATCPTGVTISSLTKNYSDGKWHVTGTATNTTSGTLAATIPVTVKTPSGNASASATLTVNVYGKLDGGKIAKDQFVCGDQQIEILKGDGSVVTDSYYGNLTTAAASGGSGNGSYKWYKAEGNFYDCGEFAIISGVNEKNYTPGNGAYCYIRAWEDETCGTAWAINAYYTDDNYISVITVNPFELIEEGFSEDTICSNENYTHELTFLGTSPGADYYEGSILQKSTDKGNTWENVANDNYVISLTPDDFSAGVDIWYRFAYLFSDCDPLPGNAVHKIHVKEVPNYADQFEDLTITLWYGACDTSIANLAAPVLTPTPAAITGPACEDGLRLAPGTYTITWNVKPDEDCDIYATYEQQLTVEYPKCGTLEEPYIITDRNGIGYNTIRIGCDCWLAENLRSDAENATYYDEDDANEAFGKLYDWNDAIGSFNAEMETKLGTTYIQGVCPMGWAVPTVAQYNTMMDVAGTAEDIKSDDENAWLSDLVGTNTSGFSAMGAGYFAGMQYQRLLGYTDFWTADLIESNSTLAKAMELRPGCDELLPVNKNKADKLSVRCVRVEPLSYININIAFDMNDDWGDGWNGAYLLAEYGDCSVKMIALDSHNECTIPVPQGSDVTLSWHSGMYDYEASFTVTNEETGEVIYQVETNELTDDEDVELTTFHVDGACNPADLQLVNFVLKSMYADGWNGGKLQVDYGTGAMNLTLPRQTYLYQDTYTVALPVGAHIILNWIAGSVDSENFFTVEYPDGTVIFNAPTVTAGTMYEFDVVKQ